MEREKHKSFFESKKNWAIVVSIGATTSVVVYALFKELRNKAQDPEERDALEGITSGIKKTGKNVLPRLKETAVFILAEEAAHGIIALPQKLRNKLIESVNERLEEEGLPKVKSVSSKNPSGSSLNKQTEELTGSLVQYATQKGIEKKEENEKGF
ncbi:MAG: hypothetical protein Q8Q24_02085 [bacterium]|nr:hypothetical protein [bacterium]